MILQAHYVIRNEYLNTEVEKRNDELLASNLQKQIYEVVKDGGSFIFSKVIENRYEEYPKSLHKTIYIHILTG